MADGREMRIRLRLAGLTGDDGRNGAPDPPCRIAFGRTGVLVPFPEAEAETAAVHEGDGS